MVGEEFQFKNEQKQVREDIIIKSVVLLLDLKPAGS